MGFFVQDHDRCEFGEVVVSLGGVCDGDGVDVASRCRICVKEESLLKQKNSI